MASAPPGTGDAVPQQIDIVINDKHFHDPEISRSGWLVTWARWDRSLLHASDMIWGAVGLGTATGLIITEQSIQHTDGIIDDRASRIGGDEF